MRNTVRQGKPRKNQENKQEKTRNKQEQNRGIPTARFLIHGIFNNMGFLIHGFSSVILPPGRTVKLHFFVPVVL